MKLKNKKGIINFHEMDNEFFDKEEKLYNFYLKIAQKVFSRTTPTDRVESERLIRRLYEIEKWEQPKKFFYVRSPFEAQQLILGLVEKKVVDPSEYGETNEEQVKNIVSEDILEGSCVFGNIDLYATNNFGPFESYWIYYAKFCLEALAYPEVTQELDESFLIYEKLMFVAGWRYQFKNVVIICDNPIQCHIVTEPGKSNFKFHNENGPAIEYADGFKIYALDGVIVDEQLVMAPETLTIKQIKQAKSPIKEIMLARSGMGLI